VVINLTILIVLTIVAVARHRHLLARPLVVTSGTGDSKWMSASPASLHLGS
jgi:hypothetical protein